MYKVSLPLAKITLDLRKSDEVFGIKQFVSDIRKNMIDAVRISLNSHDCITSDYIESGIASTNAFIVNKLNSTQMSAMESMGYIIQKLN